MKRKKFLALALAGVMTAVTLTACAPLEAAAAALPGAAKRAV